MDRQADEQHYRYCGSHNKHPWYIFMNIFSSDKTHQYKNKQQ